MTALLLLASLLVAQPPGDDKKEKADDQTKPAEKSAEPEKGAGQEKAMSEEAVKAAEQLAAEFDKEVPTVVKLRAIASEPYRIKVWLTIAEHPRVGRGLRQGVIEEIQSASERYMGGAWDVDFDRPPPDAPISPDAPIEDMPVVKKLGDDYAKVDKVLWADVSVDATRPGLPPFVVSVREWDAEFDKWGPAVKRILAPDDHLPNSVFRLLHRQFRAVIGVVGLETEIKLLRVVVKGAALQSPDSPFPLLAFGAPLKIARDFFKKDKFVRRVDILWTYLIYSESEADRRAGKCRVMSSLLQPVDNGMLRRSKVMGLAASNTENAETEVQFVTLTTDNMPGEEPGKRPVAGFEVLVRIQGQVTPVLAGNTDRRGRITLSSSRLDPTGQSKPQVCEVILRIGNLPIANFPLVPGDEARREVRVNADPLLPSVSGRINALQEKIIDTLARNAILVKRLDTVRKKLNEKEAQEDDAVRDSLTKKANELAAQINALPGNKEFMSELNVIRTETQKRSETEYKLKNLGKHVTRLFAGVEKLLKDRQIGMNVNVKTTEEAK